MATITTILATDIIAASRVTINTNFSNLNTDKVDVNSTYADPAWLTSLAGSKVTGNIGGNAATATALATARTIAGVSFNGTANIAIPSTGLSDTAQLVRNNAANTYTAGTKQTFASSATTAGAAFGGGITADPSSVAAGDFWYRADLGTFGFRNATAVDALVAGGRALSTVGSVPFVTSSGVLGQSANLFWDNANARLGVGTATPASSIESRGTSNRIATVWTTSSAADAMFENRGANSRWYTGITGSHDAKWSILNVNTSLYALQVHSATNHVTLGTTSDDGANRLQVAGTVRINSTDAGFPMMLRLVNASATSGDWRFQVPGTTSGSRDGGLEFANSSGWPHLTLSQSGTLTLHSQIPTTGSTSLIVRAGAGQGSTNLQTWQSAAGAAISYVNVFGGFASTEFYNTNDRFYQSSTFVDVGSTVLYRFSSSASQGGTKDLSLSRASANTLQVGDGGANANGYLFLSGTRNVGRTVANLPGASGNAGMLMTVTDANATTIGTTVAGGGANTVLVWSNGTNWRIYAN